MYENPTNAKIGGMLKSIYSGVMDYWLAGPTFLSVSSWPGRICVLGYGFFIFITCTSYTANLVNFMVSVKVPRKTVNSLNHLVEMNGKLCMLEAAAGSIMGAYMLKEENVLACDDYGCLMENLFLGRCQVFLNCTISDVLRLHGHPKSALPCKLCRRKACKKACKHDLCPTHTRGIVAGFSAGKKRISEVCESTTG